MVDKCRDLLSLLLFCLGAVLISERGMLKSLNMIVGFLFFPLILSIFVLYIWRSLARHIIMIIIAS